MRNDTYYQQMGKAESGESATSLLSAIVYLLLPDETLSRRTGNSPLAKQGRRANRDIALEGFFVIHI